MSTNNSSNRRSDAISAFLALSSPNHHQQHLRAGTCDDTSSDDEFAPVAPAADAAGSHTAGVITVLTHSPPEPSLVLQSAIEPTTTSNEETVRTYSLPLTEPAADTSLSNGGNLRTGIDVALPYDHVAHEGPLGDVTPHHEPEFMQHRQIALETHCEDNNLCKDDDDNDNESFTAISVSTAAGRSSRSHHFVTRVGSSITESHHSSPVQPMEPSVNASLLKHSTSSNVEHLIRKMWTTNDFKLLAPVLEALQQEDQLVTKLSAALGQVAKVVGIETAAVLQQLIVFLAAADSLQQRYQEPASISSMGSPLRSVKTISFPAAAATSVSPGTITQHQSTSSSPPLPPPLVPTPLQAFNVLQGLNRVWASVMDVMALPNAGDTTAATSGKSVPGGTPPLFEVVPSTPPPGGSHNALTMNETLLPDVFFTSSNNATKNIPVPTTTSAGVGLTAPVRPGSARVVGPHIKRSPSPASNPHSDTATEHPPLPPQQTPTSSSSQPRMMAVIQTLSAAKKLLMLREQRRHRKDSLGDGDDDFSRRYSQPVHLGVWKDQHQSPVSPDHHQSAPAMIDATDLDNIRRGTAFSVGDRKSNNGGESHHLASPPPPMYHNNASLSELLVMRSAAADVMNDSLRRMTLSSLPLEDAVFTGGGGAAFTLSAHRSVRSKLAPYGHHTTSIHSGGFGGGTSSHDSSGGTGGGGVGGAGKVAAASGTGLASFRLPNAAAILDPASPHRGSAGGSFVDERQSSSIMSSPNLAQQQVLQNTSFPRRPAGMMTPPQAGVSIKQPQGHHRPPGGTDATMNLSVTSHQASFVGQREEDPGNGRLMIVAADSMKDDGSPRSPANPFADPRKFSTRSNLRRPPSSTPNGLPDREAIAVLAAVWQNAAEFGDADVSTHLDSIITPGVAGGNGGSGDNDAVVAMEAALEDLDESEPLVPTEDAPMDAMPSLMGLMAANGATMLPHDRLMQSDGPSSAGGCSADDPQQRLNSLDVRSTGHAGGGHRRSSQRNRRLSRLRHSGRVGGGSGRDDEDREKVRNVNAAMEANCDVLPRGTLELAEWLQRDEFLTEEQRVRLTFSHVMRHLRFIYAVVSVVYIIFNATIIVGRLSDGDTGYPAWVAAMECAIDVGYFLFTLIFTMLMPYEDRGQWITDLHRIAQHTLREPLVWLPGAVVSFPMLIILIPFGYGHVPWARCNVLLRYVWFNHFLEVIWERFPLLHPNAVRMLHTGSHFYLLITMFVLLLIGLHRGASEVSFLRSVLDVSMHVPTPSSLTLPSTVAPVAVHHEDITTTAAPLHGSSSSNSGMETPSNTTSATDAVHETTTVEVTSAATVAPHRRRFSFASAAGSASANTSSSSSTYVAETGVIGAFTWYEVLSSIAERSVPYPSSESQVIISFARLFFSILAYAIIITSVEEMVVHVLVFGDILSDKLESALRSMEELDLPPELQEEILTYYRRMWDLCKTFDFQSQDGTSSTILQDFPEELREEIEFEFNAKMIRSIPLFARLSQNMNFVRLLVSQLHYIVLTPGSPIVQRGEPGDCMFFLTSGDAAIVGEDEEDHIATLCQGSFFGETTMLFGGTRPHTIIAQTLCVLYVVSDTQFDAIVDEFPEALEDIIAGAVLQMRKQQEDRKRFSTVGVAAGGVTGTTTVDMEASPTQDDKGDTPLRHHAGEEGEENMDSDDEHNTTLTPLGVTGATGDFSASRTFGTAHVALSHSSTVIDPAVVEGLRDVEIADFIAQRLKMRRLGALGVPATSFSSASADGSSDRTPKLAPMQVPAHHGGRQDALRMPATGSSPNDQRRQLTALSSGDAPTVNPLLPPLARTTTTTAVNPLPLLHPSGGREETGI